MHYILFDLETTCWESDYPKRNREIIEIGAILMDNFGDEIDRYERLVRPIEHPNLSHYCTKLTGIQQEDMLNAVPFQMMHAEFSAWTAQCYDDFVYVAWGAYDEKIIEDACDSYRMEPLLDAPYLDAKKAFHSIKRLKYKIGLSKAIKAEGMEFEGIQHRAMPDTINLARLFRKHLGEWPT